MLARPIVKHKAPLDFSPHVRFDWLGWLWSRLRLWCRFVADKDARHKLQPPPPTVCHGLQRHFQSLGFNRVHPVCLVLPRVGIRPIRPANRLPGVLVDQKAAESGSNVKNHARVKLPLFSPDACILTVSLTAQVHLADNTKAIGIVQPPTGSPSTNCRSSRG